MSGNNENANPWKPAKLPNRELAPLRNPQLPDKTPQPTGAKSKDDDTSAQPAGPKSTYTRHVVLPFDLRDRSVDIKGDVLKALLNVFPGTINLSEAGGSQARYLMYKVKNMPAQPWPATIAGVAYTVDDEHSNGQGSMFPLGENGCMSIRICQGLDLKSSVARTCREFRDLAARVTHEFTSLFPKVKVVEFMLDATDRLRIILDDSVDLDTVLPTMPGKVGNIWIVYLNDRDLGRPRHMQAEHRAIQPNAFTSTVDTSTYQMLGPGQRLISYTGESDSYWSTTSGVLVEDRCGNKFMTAASHGINSISGRVYSEVGRGAKLLGKAQVELSFTDIALVALENGLNFENEAFEDPAGGSQRLLRLVGEREDDWAPRLGDLVTLNSPCTGHIEGAIMSRSWRMVFPEEADIQHPTEAALNYIVYNWVWMQPGSRLGGTMIPDSTCGAPIVDEGGRVLGFFQYYIDRDLGSSYAGLYCSVSAEEVVYAGYKLVKNT